MIYLIILQRIQRPGSFAASVKSTDDPSRGIGIIVSGVEGELKLMIVQKLESADSLSAYALKFLLSRWISPVVFEYFPFGFREWFCDGFL